jgi:hypothetical protein
MSVNPTHGGIPPYVGLAPIMQVFVKSQETSSPKAHTSMQLSVSYLEKTKDVRRRKCLPNTMLDQHINCPELKPRVGYTPMPTGAGSMLVWKTDFVCTGKEVS